VDEVRTAVYFSKHIRLANGESLFQLIQHCSSGWDSRPTWRWHPGKTRWPAALTSST
jgi:hypothetical protein